MFGSLDSLMKISTARSRSISAENVYGEPGRGGMAEVSDTPQPEVVRIGQGWSPTTAVRASSGRSGRCVRASRSRRRRLRR